VGDIKAIKDGSTYVAVDGGMADNLRFALYQADYWVTVADRAKEAADGVYTVAGKCCESGDLITRDKPMQKPATWDTLCVFATGAYNYSMASNYNCICRPPVVLLENGEARLAVRRQTFEDLTVCEVGPEESK
jgi:diaminopimelate decarboxylase